MGVRSFETRLATGSLNGQKLLIVGEVRVEARRGPLCPLAQDSMCYVGTLAGSAIDLLARPIATVEGEGTAIPSGASSWGFWRLPSAPSGIGRIMAVSVDSAGVVEFLGYTPPEEMAIVMSEIQYVDFDAMPLDEIRIVPAWLTGIVAPISCGPPEPGAHIAGLPGRSCGNPSWLAPDPLRVDPTGYTIPDTAFQVQSNAYLEFAPDPAGANGSAEPRAGLYVIAKRLEGSGCPDGPPPCWQWEIVGRVTINGNATQAGPIATPAPSNPPATPTSSACEGDAAISVSFMDTTGVVVDCSVIGVDRHNPTGATNPSGDLSSLQVLWGTSRCTTAAFLELSRVGDGYVVEIRESESSNCEFLPEAYAVQLALSAPVPAALVSVSVLRDLEAPSSPEPLAPIDCPTAVRVPADDEPTWRALVHDETGLIDSCTIGSTLGRVGDPPIVVSNTDGTSLRLLVEWEESPCVDETPFQFRHLGDGYELIAERTTVSCPSPLERRALYLDVAQPVLADLIAASVSVIEPEPTATPEVVPTPDVAPPPADTVFECTQPKGEVGAVVIDSFGLVDSCATVEATGEGVAEDPVVRNPDGILMELQIEWPGTPCAAAVAYTVMPGATGISIEVGPRPDGRTLSEDGVCIQPLVIHAIRLQLSGRVDARNVWISRTAVPNTSIRTVGCVGSEVGIQDSSGLVVSCRGTAVDLEPADGNPLITNHVGDTSRLNVFWAFQDPSACGPQPPTIALEFKRTTFEAGFVVSTAADFVPGTGCLGLARWFGLEIELSEPVAASDVAFASSGRGAVDTARTHVGIFDLVIRSEELEYFTGEPIEIDADLQFNGGDDTGNRSVELWGVGSLVNGFGIKQLDGPLVMGPTWDEPCVRHELQHREPLRVPYEKSAGWSDDDPNAAFYRDWVQGEELLLPVGTWLVTAYSEFAIGSDCAGPLVSLQASQVIVVR